MIRNQLLLIIFLLGIKSYAQNVNPGDDIIYNPQEVAVIEITMPASDKTFLLADENIYSEEYLPATFRFKNSSIDTTLAHQVGVRLRGNTSRGHPKKSFKIKFKEYDGSKFYGYKKFNLKAENNDPSHIREMLALETFRLAGMPAARAHHTKVFMNGEYMGLYLNVEQIDDEFALTRFGNDTGNLYKCHWGSTLEDDGQIYDEVLYELETNKDANDRSILANFVSVLNHTPDEDFKTEIEKVLHVGTAIKYFAVEALIGHWDGYSYLKNNLYIYENPETGLIEIIPYDVDNTFGIDWIGRDWAARDLADWAKHGKPRPLNTRLLTVEEYRALYFTELNNLLDNIFNESALFPKFDFYEGLLTSAIAEDTYYPLTFGFSMKDFFDSHDKKVTSHAPYGLKPYVIARTGYALQQITSTYSGFLAFTDSQIHIYPNPSDGRYIHVSATGDDCAGTGITIYNSAGQPVVFQTEKSLIREKISFTQKLPAGIYVISMGNAREKFLVK